MEAHEVESRGQVARSLFGDARRFQVRIGRLE